eukprot:PhF_6_TR30374/c0_g2_i4/m.44502
MTGHSERVTSVAFSPDNKYIVSGSEDGSVSVWDASSGEEVRVMYGHLDGVSSVAFSPDNKYIVSGSQDSTVRMWDATSEEDLKRFEGQGEIVHDTVTNTYRRVARKCNVFGRIPVHYPFRSTIGSINTSPDEEKLLNYLF